MIEENKQLNKFLIADLITESSIDMVITCQNQNHPLVLCIKCELLESSPPSMAAGGETQRSGVTGRWKWERMDHPD